MRLVVRVLIELTGLIMQLLLSINTQHIKKFEQTLTNVLNILRKLSTLYLNK